MSPLPVTLIGGFLGAGKTSLLHHLVSEHQGGHLAVLVENLGSLNLDAKALRGLCGAMRRMQDVVVEIPNVGEEEQLAWIAAALAEFSQSGRFERVLIEIAGTTNPARFADYFLTGGIFADAGKLEQIITVVDALAFTQKADALSAFVREQVAGATLVVLNKCDLVDQKARDVSMEAIHRLNVTCRVIETAYGEIPGDIPPATLAEISAATQRQSEENTEDFPALAASLYRSYRPFHPARFWKWFNANHAGLERVKGLVWLASRSLLVGGISRTRWQNSCGAAGIWWAALPREEWPEEIEALSKMQETWREPYGDRRQELVLIGDAAQLPAVVQGLNACLLTDVEFAQSVKEWSKFPDPFPEWDVE